MKKLVSIIIVTAMVLSLLTGCGSSTSPSPSPSPSTSPSNSTPAVDGKVYEMKIAHQAPKIDVQYQSFEWYKKELETRSNGRIKVTIYPNNEISTSDQNLLEMTMSGAIHQTTVPGFTFIVIDKTLKAFNITDCPFLFQKKEDVYAFTDGEYGTSLRKQAEEKIKGIKVYNCFPMGWYNLYANSPLMTPDDLKGLKIRVSASDIYIAIIKAWGGQAIPVNWAEVYTALQQGLVDGLSTPNILFNYQKFYEVSKNCVAINYGTLAHYPIVNRAFYESLPDDLRVIFDGCIADYIKKTRELHAQASEEAFKSMEQNGVKVHYPNESEMKQWIDRVTPLWGEFSYFYGEETLAEVRKILGK